MKRAPAAPSSTTAMSKSMRAIRLALRRSLAVIVILFAIPANVWGAEGAGTVKTLTGSATVGRDSSVQPIAVGHRVFPGDRIVSGPGSHVGIMLHDDTRLTVGPGSELLIGEFAFNPSSHKGNLAVSFLKGTARVATGLIARNSPGNVRFHTPQGTIAIRGTEFVVDLEPE